MTIGEKKADYNMGKGFIGSLLILCVCGFLGILIDLDHLVTFIVWGKFTREAHISGLFISWLAWFLGSAYCLRLFYKDMVRIKQCGEHYGS